MPVGVPKVPFRGPGDEEASWVDLYNRLYRQRALFLGQKVDSTISNQIVGLMVYLTLEDSTKDLYLFINSPGGWIISGIAIYDIMQAVQPDVQTVCIGLAASMASFILTGGEITKRTALPHAWVMMHQPVADLRDKTKAGEFIMEVGEVMGIYDSIVNTYVQRTGKPSWVIYKDLERDIFMSAEEAQAHGIVDLVGLE
uniref:ATP-dependent Clp protease proteolytic subunit n=2 Tax=Albizia TaxID=3812 RepID=A0A8E5KI09_ALBJU|nr:ATP-dependent Clp protease proteolytic subunit 1 [Albizia julibrissin]QVH34188.1 ATP-dependent Clp protease proteolytic subunit 1 [Albizia julibrissin]UEV86377.1 clp protease proteolytic subunit [Albizia kalkora]UYR95802.1 ATP-dependent Clp protease proteolytic subunit [Albizia julibrissin]